MRDYLRRLLGWFSHVRPIVITPPERTYVVPYNLRLVLVEPAIRVYVVPQAEDGEVSVTFIKHSYDEEDYAFDWVERLDGDTLSASTWETASGLTIEDSDREGTVTTVWLSGGSDGDCVYVTNKVTTLGGRRWARVMEIRIDDTL